MEVLFPEYFHQYFISIVWNNYRNWIFQPFSTIFPKYFHTMEEFQFLPLSTAYFRLARAAERCVSFSPLPTAPSCPATHLQGFKD